MSDLKQTVWESINMLEAYYDEARKLPNDNSKCLSLKEEDLQHWKDVYYPLLVKSGVIRDGVFFQDPIVNLNYGIGIDGICTKYEYVQYLWSAYQYVVTDFSANLGLQYIKECIDMLEPYTYEFQNRSTETKMTKGLNNTDMNRWKHGFYQFFSKSGLIPDGQFFGDIEAKPNLGIGADGAFTGEELCHFLYQLYKFAAQVTQ